MDNTVHSPIVTRFGFETITISQARIRSTTKDSKKSEDSLPLPFESAPVIQKQPGASRTAFVLEKNPNTIKF